MLSIECHGTRVWKGRQNRRQKWRLKGLKTQGSQFYENGTAFADILHGGVWKAKRKGDSKVLVWGVGRTELPVTEMVTQWEKQFKSIERIWSLILASLRHLIKIWEKISSKQLDEYKHKCGEVWVLHIH